MLTIIKRIQAAEIGGVLSTNNVGHATQGQGGAFRSENLPTSRGVIK